MARVLVVDDERSIRITLREFLVGAGHEVFVAEDATEAVDILGAEGIDVVLTDIILPRITGIGLLNSIRDAAAEVQVIMMTGEPTMETATAALRAGAFDYLSKPIPKDAVLKAVANAAHMKDLEDEKRRLEEENWHHQQHLERLVGVRTAQLEAERDWAHRYLDIADVVLVALDRDGCVTMLNRKGCELLGFREEELIGESWFEQCLPEEHRERTREGFRGLMTGELEPMESFENPVTTRGGQERLIAWRNSILREADGKISGTLSSGEDITERRLLEEQLLQAQKLEAIGQLAGGVAHDFNNILQAMFIQLELALDPKTSVDEVRHHVDGIREGANSAAALTRQLLAFSRRQVLQARDLNVSELVSGVMTMLRRIIGEDVRLELSVAGDLPVVRADPDQLRQVIVNLCVNARDAMPDGGTISLGAEPVRLSEDEAEARGLPGAGEYVELTVADTGHGMDAETLGRVFEPFFTTKAPGRGTGLGLSTVYGVVCQHGGAVFARSAPGAGSTFHVCLPASESPATTGSPAGNETLLCGIETILLAEDDEIVRELAAEVLTRAGYTVLSAADGQEAVEVYEAHGDEIDLALLDVVMPGLGGPQVLDRLRAKSPLLPALFSTGYSKETANPRFTLAAGVRMIQKPYRLQALLTAVREILDGR